MGTALWTGRATRRVWFEGYETVAACGRRYEDCIRLRGLSELRLGWWLTLRLEEYAWLARGVGVVCRTEHIGGRFVLLGFSAAYDYELVDRRDLVGAGGASGDGIGRRVRRLAVHLDRGPPAPRIGGLVFDWDDGSEAPGVGSVRRVGRP
ncbi:MAG: hypothetical protein ACE5E6_08795 [Phycisphaerae bacterium]